MNEIRKNDEHWKDNLIGLTFTRELEKQMMQRHALETTIFRTERRLEDLKKQLNNLALNRPLSLEGLENISEVAAVTVLKPKTNKIMDVGFNVLHDLILNNFGIWLSGFIKQPAIVDSYEFALIDITNTSQTFNFYSDGSPSPNHVLFNNLSTYAIGTQLQVGSGTTAAARTNYAIETPFGNAPENTRFSTGAGSYASAAISFSGAISAGGAGTVNEMGFFGYWPPVSEVPKTIMLFHDILSSGVPFVAAETLNASYSILL